MNYFDDDISSLNTSDEYQISNFNDFELFTNNAYVQSYNTGDQIYFNYSEGIDSTIRREQYIFRFDEFGSCADFSITTRFNYSMTGYVDAVTYRIFIGSYYFESGSFAGVSSGDGNQPSKLTGGGFWDASGYHTGKYVAIGYPEDIKDRQETEYGSMQMNGQIEVCLERNGSIVKTTVNDSIDDLIQIGYLCTSGIEKRVDYVLLDFYASGYNTNAAVIVDYISGTFHKKGSQTIAFPSLTTRIFILVLVSLATFSWIVKKRIKKIEV
jgi:hypothetical protein